jgi:hypothetical protein
MKLLFLFCLIIAFSFNGFSQENTQPSSIQRNNLHIKKISGSVKIDGILNEPEWQTAEIATGFWKKFPTDDGPASKKTEAKTMYNDQFLYISFTAYDSSKAFVSGLKRDIGHDGNDCVAIILDPQNEKTNGFVFVVNAFNTQSEDLLSPDGDDVMWSWDNKWFSATKRYDHYWTVEFAIPFKTLRYAAGKKEWAVNFLRVDTKTNEYSVWNKVPVNFRSMDLGYTGKLLWDDAPPSPGRNMVVIPYVTGQVVGNKENNAPAKGKANAGFDAKIALNSALNLDLTVNPDFAQVEVDRQVTNLTRFNIFFPERRNFFLENADLYSVFGIPPIRPFYSRRIGLDKNGNQIPILGGARLTGNLNKTTRIGILNMQTGRKGDYSPENYTAISINKRVLKRSTIRGYVLNRQAFLTEEEKQKDPLLEFGRNAGVELNYSDEAGKWNIWSSYHHSFKPGIQNNNQYYSVGGAYSVRTFNAVIDAGSLGTNYYTDMGFIARVENYDALKDTVIRLGFKQVYANSSYKIFPKKGPINQHEFEVENFIVFNPNFSFNENNSSFGYNMMFKNTSMFRVSYDHTQLQLQFPTSFTGATPLPKDNYSYGSISSFYRSDFRKNFGFNIGGNYGGFYNGTSYQIEAGINYRNIPHLNVALNFNYYNLQFPDPYGKTELFLISPRVELNFTTNIFWTTFIQYNTQGNNFNINSRFQWRFKPMSDLFLVYTDNYFTDPFLKNKNRAIVMKLNYWLNL